MPWEANLTRESREIALSLHHFPHLPPKIILSSHMIPIFLPTPLTEKERKEKEKVAPTCWHHPYLVGGFHVGPPTSPHDLPLAPLLSSKSNEGKQLRNSSQFHLLHTSISLPLSIFKFYFPFLPCSLVAKISGLMILVHPSTSPFF